MAITATIVHSGHNRLRYLLATDSTGSDTGGITTIGSPTPDVLTDLGTNQGPVMLMAKVVAQGYAQFASGAQTQAKARALWLSDRSGADPGGGGYGIVCTSMCRITPRTGASSGWFVDANTSGGNPIIVITSIGVGPSATAYLDIYVGDTIGD